MRLLKMEQKKSKSNIRFVAAKNQRYPLRLWASIPSIFQMRESFANFPVSICSRRNRATMRLNSPAPSANRISVWSLLPLEALQLPQIN